MAMLHIHEQVQVQIRKDQCSTCGTKIKEMDSFAVTSDGEIVCMKCYLSDFRLKLRKVMANFGGD